MPTKRRAGATTPTLQRLESSKRQDDDDILPYDAHEPIPPIINVSNNFLVMIIIIYDYYDGDDDAHLIIRKTLTGKPKTSDATLVVTLEFEICVRVLRDVRDELLKWGVRPFHW
jgi:hypothetical protein